ncbi:MAG TPA: DUF3108 domain-containing protein, partial [Telluria sp.]|nr:DUF3108 domain-containing protein [Telluria sp.]
MSLAFSFAQRRRTLVLATVVFLLHWVALGWLVAQLGPKERSVREESALVVTQVLAPKPKPAPEPRRPDAVPKPRKMERPQAAPQPEPAPPPVAEPVPQAATEVAAATEQGSGTVASNGTVQDGAAGSAGGVQSAAQPEPVPAVAAPPTFRVDMPPSADMAMDVARVDADGTRWSGEATISWRLAGASYRMQVEAGIRLLFARVNLVVLTSEGDVLDSGFAPQRMT